MKTIYSYLLILLFLGCRDNASQDNAPKLPPETQTGANTFGCYVNGRLFYPRDGTPSVGSNPVGVEFIALGNYPTYTYRELMANNYRDGKPINNFIMHFQKFNGTNGLYEWKKSNYKYGLDGAQANYLLVRAYDYKENVWKWFGSYDNSGQTVITKYENGIFSGTFSGTLITEDGKATIEITNGIFDFNLFTLPNKTWP